MIIIALIIIACLKGNARELLRNIPGPVIDSSQDLEIAQGSTLTLRGSGFINNYPIVHKVTAIKLKGKRVTKIQLPVLTANANYLHLAIPQGMELGDYDLKVKIKTKLLESKVVNLPSMLKLRPAPLPAPKLEYSVITDSTELNNLIPYSSNALLAINGDLQIGINQISQSYTRDGFQSIRSPMTNFYYLPEPDMESQLKIDSESPIKSFAIEKLENKLIDVSNITNSEIEELSKSFYLKSKTNPRYLEYSVKLSPVFFEKVHAFEEEFAVIKNRSSSDFILKSCILADSIQNRYKFADKDLVLAKQSFTITQNLGLNNTSPDALKLLCPNESQSLTLIDEFKYEKIDADGFGIKI